MIPPTLGAAVGGIQPGVPPQKTAQTEPFPQPAQEQLETSVNVSKEVAAPVVPPTNGASISLESVTALQQADATAADNKTQFAQARVSEHFAAHDEAAAATSAPVSTAEAEGLETAESRQSAATEVPVGEETDNAGRSVRNPLNLQI